MTRLRSARSLLATGVVFALVLALAACRAPSSPDGPPRPEPAPTPEPAEDIPLRLYFVRGEVLGVAGREIPRTEAVAEAAVRELLAGPSSEESGIGLSSQIPEGTRLLGLRVADGVATVDLSGEFESGGGSRSMQMRVAQVVFTLTQFSTVQRVAFMIGGRPVRAIGGEGVVVSPPVDRIDFADATAPAILVESPVPFKEVSSPVRVTGMSNTFEANLRYELRGPGGELLEEGFSTATSGTGTWGTFDFTISYDSPGDGDAEGTLVLLEESAEDGSRINQVEIPLQLTE